MPWDISENDESCPASRPFAVRRTGDSTALVACHETREAAEAQLRALYANEPEAGK